MQRIITPSLSKHESSLLAFAIIAAASVWGPFVLQKAKTKAQQLLQSQIVDDEIMILPPPQQTVTTSVSVSNDTSSNNVLLIIFPGALIKAKEYVSIAKQVQKQAMETSDMVVTVGIAPQVGFGASQLARWAFAGQSNDTVVAFVKEHAQKAAFGSNSSQSFDNVFPWGHSMGCNEAIQTAYPSSYSGLILYGGCWDSFIGKKSADLMSYPRPTLTMIGERDGFLRYLYLASDLAHQEGASLASRGLTVMATATTNNSENGKEVRTQDDFIIERKVMLHKPIVTVPELNHLHMSLGILPTLTRLSGRSDFHTKFESMEAAQSRLGSIVVDFMNVHCQKKMNYGFNVEESKRDVVEAEQRLLQYAATTKQSLKPFMELSSRDYNTRFIQKSQSQLITTDAPILKGLEKVIIEWRSVRKDFLFSKPKCWQTDGGNGKQPPQYVFLQLQAMEQSPISITSAVNSHRKSMSKTLAPAQIQQISKTLAIKSKSKEGILSFLNQQSDDVAFEGDDTLSNPLKQLNQQTFDHVLNVVVNEQQRERYLQEGAHLTFGPDICIDSPPKWVDAPLLLSEYERNLVDIAVDSTTDTKCNYYYVLQSPYVETPAPMEPPFFAGMHYYKILTPAQAYEWIVFDCFK